MDTQIQEFKDLELAVATLIHHNEESYEQQKQFIGNASHELQTPLAIMINKLEIMAETGGLNQEQAETVAAVLATAERLVRLNKSLLLLSKIENKQFLHNADLPFNALVLNIVAELEAIAAFKKVSINVVQEDQLSVQMDSALANIVVSNLLRNALFHNKLGGEVNIRITNKGLTVSNTSTHAALDANLVFSRFYKSDAASKGIGLGLAIVQAICHLYGFAIVYQYENNQHSFQVNMFP